MKAFLLIIITLFSSIKSFAQNAPIVFATKTANFGKVKEEIGKIHYDYVFTNKGDFPIKIEDVKTSCGCTVAEFPKLAIPKDSSSYIKVTFNTTNRPGEINKTVSVFFSKYEQPIILTLKGIVIGNHRLFERELVYPFGNLRFQSKTLNMGTLRTNEPVTKEFEFYNAGKNDIELKGILFDSTFLLVKSNKTVFKTKELSKLTVIYNANARKNYGYVSDTIRLITSDDSVPNKSINISAHIEESFKNIDAASLEKAPKIKFEKTDTHLGTLKEGNPISYTFKFTNEGKEDLQIRKIVPGCDCITFETPKYVLRPEESSYIRITMDTKDREGVQNKYITVISNSPSNPSVNLWIRMNVVN